jgi:hypothetical protein
MILYGNELQNVRSRTDSVEMMYVVIELHTIRALSKTSSSPTGQHILVWAAQKDAHRTAAAARSKLLLSTRTGHEPRPTVYIVSNYVKLGLLFDGVKRALEERMLVFRYTRRV